MPCAAAVVLLISRGAGFGKRSATVGGVSSLAPVRIASILGRSGMLILSLDAG